MVLPAYAQLMLLLAAVPLQYYLVSQVPVSDGELRAKAATFLSRLYNLYDWSVDVWRSSSDTQLMIEKFLNFFMSPAAGRPHRPSPSSQQTPVNDGHFEDEEAVDVQREQETWFGQSSEIRRTLPSDLQFRVGEVVYHNEWHWRGVVIAWDSHAKVPDYWLQENGIASDHESLSQPWYLVLVDEKDKAGATAYVPQHSLSADELAVEGVSHPQLVTYFKSARRPDNRYVAQPWLKERYPND
ncbi:uncharacterized protein LOC135806660 [Sycon ciliatum]|uniref:uncharacterized protein LOC135806660 n=1 Tax=Sycon ciliatum TaxID=27933 RepID=UPI0031F6AFF8